MRGGPSTSCIGANQHSDVLEGEATIKAVWWLASRSTTKARRTWAGGLGAGLRFLPFRFLGVDTGQSVYQADGQGPTIPIPSGQPPAGLELLPLHGDDRHAARQPGGEGRCPLLYAGGASTGGRLAVARQGAIRWTMGAACGLPWGFCDGVV